MLFTEYIVPYYCYSEWQLVYLIQILKAGARDLRLNLIYVVALCDFDTTPLQLVPNPVLSNKRIASFAVIWTLKKLKKEMSRYFKFQYTKLLTFDEIPIDYVEHHGSRHMFR